MPDRKNALVPRPRIDGFHCDRPGIVAPGLPGQIGRAIGGLDVQRKVEPQCNLNHGTGRALRCDFLEHDAIGLARAAVGHTDADQLCRAGREREDRRRDDEIGRLLMDIRSVLLRPTLGEDANRDRFGAVVGERA